MAYCNWRLEKTKDAEMRAVLKSLLEINSDKLRIPPERRLFGLAIDSGGKEETLFAAWIG